MVKGEELFTNCKVGWRKKKITVIIRQVINTRSWRETKHSPTIGKKFQNQIALGNLERDESIKLWFVLVYLWHYYFDAGGSYRVPFPKVKREIATLSMKY